MHLIVFCLQLPSGRKLSRSFMGSSHLFNERVCVWVSSTNKSTGCGSCCLYPYNCTPTFDPVHQVHGGRGAGGVCKISPNFIQAPILPSARSELIKWNDYVAFINETKTVTRLINIMYAQFYRQPKENEDGWVISIRQLTTITHSYRGVP